MSVTPLASRSSQRNCSTGTALAMCQLAPLENFTARTMTSALGFSAAASCMWGSASRMAVLSDWILPP